MSLIPVVIFGGIVGVLINYFSDVLPISRRFTQPICEECKQPFSIKEYLIFSSCSTCGKKVSTRPIIVLICSILICILLKYFLLSTLSFWAALPILVFLGVIMVIDIEHRVVLLQTSIFGFVLLFLYGIRLHGFLSTIFGALAGFLIMLIFYFLGIVVTKIAGKLKHREINEVTFGFGDVWIGTILGLFAGWPYIIGAIFISILASAAFSIVLLVVLFLSKKYRAFASTLPFTTFLILGAIVIFYL
jgi:leader peptidase (prepilin peptidase) / N-methyltransferase